MKKLEDKKLEVEEVEQAKVQEELEVELQIKDSILEEILERLKWKLQLNSNMIPAIPKIPLICWKPLHYKYKQSIDSNDSLGLF